MGDFFIMNSIEAMISAGLTGSTMGTNIPSGKSASDATPFGSLISDALSQMKTLEGQERAAVEGLFTGAGVDIHQAMISTQKVAMAFELALAVRNKAVQAYQSVIGMQF